MGKIVSGVMTDVAVYLTSHYLLLPAHHGSGLPGCTTTDSLLYLTHKIKDAWRRKRVVTIIFLDIANAFPNAGETGPMFLYLIYNHLLVSIPKGPNQNGGAYVDDTFFMAIADTFEECDTILNGMLDKQEMWSRTHNSNAEVSKFQCLRLTQKTGLTRTDFKRPTGEIIKCVQVAKLLGVLLDENLQWHPQPTSAVKKATDLTLAISRLA
ncbi:hypothetical protein M422DRAFT_262768 [Sphaerobolus stellatus SS14]|uniref:Reverse transcriptase domain-containing protein n=1 Tax=Sphaerobolus stellatus (strain SS14) TaxID=990650 RepID=A0A0C9VBZ1_SPHS4|nr:hypothetical protein M422DRAFT_262768 [Sphaerobolus stellatus SS14]